MNSLDSFSVCRYAFSMHGILLPKVTIHHLQEIVVLIRFMLVVLNAICFNVMTLYEIKRRFDI